MDEPTKCQKCGGTEFRAMKFYDEKEKEYTIQGYACVNQECGAAATDFTDEWMMPKKLAA